MKLIWNLLVALGLLGKQIYVKSSCFSQVHTILVQFFQWKQTQRNKQSKTEWDWYQTNPLISIEEFFLIFVLCE